jgi:hypothetical protein
MPRRQERRRGRPRWPGRKLRPNSASSRSRNVGEPSGRPMVAAEQYKPRPRLGQPVQAAWLNAFATPVFSGSVDASATF